MFDRSCLPSLLTDVLNPGFAQARANDGRHAPARVTAAAGSCHRQFAAGSFLNPLCDDEILRDWLDLLPRAECLEQHTMLSFRSCMLLFVWDNLFARELLA